MSQPEIKTDLNRKVIDEVNESQLHFNKWLVIKDLVVLGLSFVLNFTAYQGLAALQSSYNSVGGLGTVGLSTTYASVVISALIVSPLLIGWLGPKWTMTITLFGYFTYCCCNFYPTWVTIIPGSILIGVCGAPLWAAMSVYTVTLAKHYVIATDKPSYHVQKILPVFFGVFFALVTGSNLWGNLISFIALTGDIEQNNTQANNNNCGYKFCSGQANASGVVRPTAEKFYLMNGCFTAASGISIALLAFGLSRRDAADDRQLVTWQQVKSNIAAMAKHMLDWKQILLIPLTANVGLSQSFAFGEFTEAFIACSSGIPSVGKVMMVYGATQVVCCSVTGLIAGKTGSMPVVLTAMAIQISLEISALFWNVSSSSMWQLFLFAAAWGAVDTVWNSQMNALYGEYFDDKLQAAYSSLRFWPSWGYIVGFSYNKLLCIQQKLYIMLTLSSVAIAGAISAAILHRRHRNKVKDESN